MSRLKLVLLGLLAAFALSAIGSASASAACGPPVTQYVFCYHNNVEIHEEAVSGTSGISILEGKIGGAAVKIECENDTFVGELKLLGATKGTITFKKCKVLKPAECKLEASQEEKILASFTDKLIGTITGVMKPEDEFTGSGGEEEFTTLNLIGCSIAGAYKVTGKQVVELPNAEISLATHEVVAKKAGSKLKLGVESASFSSTATIKLSGSHPGLPWLVMLGN